MKLPYELHDDPDGRPGCDQQALEFVAQRQCKFRRDVFPEIIVDPFEVNLDFLLHAVPLLRVDLPGADDVADDRAIHAKTFLLFDRIHSISYYMQLQP